MKNLSRIALLVLTVALLSSCGIFRSTSKVKTSESAKTETVVSSEEITKDVTLDKSTIVTKEVVTGVAKSPRATVTNKGVPAPGEIIHKVDSLSLIELKMWIDSAGDLMTEATKPEQSIPVLNAGFRETISYNDIQTTTDTEKSLKSTEKASSDIDGKTKTSEGQNLLKLLPFFLIIVVAVFFFFWLGRKR